jgi:Voltage gated chloride channel
MVTSYASDLTICLVRVGSIGVNTTANQGNDLSPVLLSLHCHLIVSGENSEFGHLCTFRQNMYWNKSGVLLGAALGYAWSAMWPGVPIGFFALLGAGAVLSATTQGPISAVVLMLELTGRDRSFILPLILIAALSTLIARSIEPRSIYDARLSDEQIESRQKMREQEPNEIGIPR